jgi:glycosyltransferase involved in cell wall biosynthesis
MLKIAVITRYFPNSAEPWQGRSAYQTLRVLSKEATVRVFFPNAKYLPGFKPRTRLYDELDLSYKPKEVGVSYYNFPALPLISRPINGWMAARVLLPDIRKFAPDLVLSFFLYPDGFAGLRIAKTLSIPFVGVSIGSDINNIRDAASARHTRTVLREADFIVTKSHDLRAKAILMGASPDRSRAVLNGCDLSVFHPSDRAEARRKLGINESCQAIVYIGRIDKRKGLMELVQAASLLHTTHPNVQVYMVGEGPDRHAVEHAIKSKHAESYIHAMASCAPEEVAAWIAAADLVTLPSYMEGCPNVVLEALASGRPVVASNVGGISEIMNNECGCLVPPRNPQSLAHGLEAVLHRPWVPEEIAAGWSRSWKSAASELSSILQLTLANRNRERDRA